MEVDWIWIIGNGLEVQGREFIEKVIDHWLYLAWSFTRYLTQYMSSDLQSETALRVKNVYGDA